MSAVLSRQRWPLQSQCDAFYGNPRNGSRPSAKWMHDNLVMVKCPWVLSDGHSHFAHITIHEKCAASLSRVLAWVWDVCDHSQAEIDHRGYSVFSGSFNYRPMRGSSHLSMHAYGCAIDWDAPHNPQHSAHPRFKPDELLLEAFRDEGWVCGIDWRGNSIDAMHVQAARVG